MKLVKECNPDVISMAKSAERAKRDKESQKTAIAAALAAEKQLNTLLAIPKKPTVLNFQCLKGSSPEGVAVVIPGSDWHIEEKVSKSAVNGKNFYNVTEAEKRIRRFYSKSVELLDWYRKLSPVAELWHPLLGDLLTGYIHEELMESNSLSPTEACVLLQDLICSGIDLLLRETKLNVIIPTCVGNHGRTTAKKHIKTSIQNSYEWLLYMTLAKFYASNPRVDFRVGRGYHNIQTIMGRKVRFHHGDGLRYNGGIGGITIPVNKSIAQWDKVNHVDFDIFGHWHTHLVSYPKWVSCGSAMGYSEFSLEIKAEFQHPTQAFIVIDRRYGLTMAEPIFLTPPSRR